jgi:hypothetical protein
MTEELHSLVEHKIKQKELEELFGTTELTDEQMKEALWQVHSMVHAPELRQLAQEQSHIAPEKVEKLAPTQRDVERLNKILRGSTITEKGYPAADVMRAFRGSVLE